MMKETLPVVPFQSVRKTTIAMQVSVPFAVLLIGEMLKAPLVNLLMPIGIKGIASQTPSHQCGDDRFIVWPPELHIVPVFL